MQYHEIPQYRAMKEKSGNKVGFEDCSVLSRETRFLCKDSKFTRYPCEKRLEGRPPYSACLQQPRSCKSLCNELVCWYIHDTLTSATLIHVPNCFLMLLRTELLYLFASHHPHHCLTRRLESCRILPILLSRQNFFCRPHLPSRPWKRGTNLQLPNFWEGCKFQIPRSTWTNPESNVAQVQDIHMQNHIHTIHTPSHILDEKGNLQVAW